MASTLAYSAYFEHKTIDEEHATFIDAAAHGDLETVRKIIYRGRDEPQKVASLINARDDDGFSVLTHAVTGKQFATIDTLLTCRADPNSADNFRQHSFTRCSQYGRLGRTDHHEKTGLARFDQAQCPNAQRRDTHPDGRPGQSHENCPTFDQR